MPTLADWWSPAHTDSHTATARIRRQVISPFVRLGGTVTASPKSEDLQRALDLIFQPLLVEALTAIGEGKALEDALPVDTDAELLGAALNRLITIKAVEPSHDRLLGHHALTPRGTRLLQLLDDLEDAMMRTGRPQHV
jgi:hypothetical protein